MNPTDVATATNAAIVHVVWGMLILVLCVCGVLFFFLEKKLHKTTTAKERLENLALTQSRENALLRGKIADDADGIEALKTEVRRADAIRAKCEARLVEQNNLVDVLRAESAMYKAHWDAQQGAT